MSSESSVELDAPAGRDWRWGVFGNLAFTIILIASSASNVGFAMFDTSMSWLMTSLNPDPMMVSAVQVATTLPMFLMTLPAGVLADIVDLRGLLIGVQLAVTAISIVFASIVTLHWATPAVLLATTFSLGATGALAAPAWLVITPMLVPKHDLDSAVAINNASYNVSRAVGPALGGLAIAAFSIALPFWCFFIGNVAVVAALLWWRAPRRALETLPAERLSSALRTGLRYVRNNRDMDLTLIRALAFFPFASAYWALLPLVARMQMHNGPEVYGVLVGMIGVGSILGSLALNGLKARLGPDRLAALGTVGTIIALALYGAAHEPAIALAASLIAGALMDHHDDDALRFRAGGLAGVGSWTGSGDISDGVFRRDDARQRRLGQGRQHGRAFHGPLRRRGGRGSWDDPDGAAQAANRRRARPQAIDALAHAGVRASGRGR